MRSASVAILFGLLLVVSAQAQAATVSPQGGRVFVNAGDGFVAVVRSTNAAPGAEILIRDGGSAVISYNNGCTVRVGAGRVWRIANMAPCSNGTKYIDMAALTGRQGAEGEVGVPPADVPVTPPPPTISPLIIGGVVVGAGVGIAVAVSKKNDDDPPASP